MADSADPSRKPKPNPYNNYLKYSGLAFQLLATLFLCGWIGYKLDGWLDMKYPIFMIVLGFVGFAGSIYQLYRSVNKS
jgi:F0F1-type ATP synthase assembly protein I